VATPDFVPAQGPLTSGSLIFVSCATANAVIRYTLDGSEPTTNSSVYTEPFWLAEPITLTARAFRNDLLPSDARSVFFGLLDFERTVVTTLAGGPGPGFTNAIGTAAAFSNPQGINLDRLGNCYVADTGNNVIRKILPSGLVTTFAGTGVAGSQTGQAANSQFSAPTGVCLDDIGNVFIADGNNCNRICKVDTNGLVTVLAYRYPDCYHGPALWQMTCDQHGNVYVGSWASVQKITPDGSVINVGGPGWCCPDGWDVLVGPGIDGATNVYAATSYDVWKIAPDGATELFAGTAPGFSDGFRLLARFQSAQDAFTDLAGNLVVTDLTRVRSLRLDGRVRSLAGTGATGYKNGRGSAAQFNGATGICADTNGNVYVADSGNHCVRKISPDSAGIGIADDWQVAHFGQVGIDPNGDPDHDGMSNYAEFWAGTDPLAPASALVISSVGIVSNNHTQISWQSVPGKSYLVKYSSDLITWNTLGTPIPGTGVIASITDPTSTDETGQRFYRVFVNF
jgi:sugar lactone lactonase YvrE